MILEENNRLGDILKYEADKNYCREVVTIAVGQNLKLGTIVGMSETTDEVKIVSLDAEDGSDEAIGILLEDADATENSLKVLMVARDAIVSENHVLFPVNATVDQKKKLLKDLSLRGLVVRASV